MKSKQIAQSKLRASKLAAFAIVVGIILLTACGMPNAGVKKDLSSGLSTNYSGITIEDAAVTMDDAEIHHNKIPLGKSFTIINKNVSGLIEKEGKLSLGCALLITDESGNKILDEADLFAGKEGVPVSEGKYLTCKVNTGEPMQKEKNYNVEVKFWDKNGTGKILNKYQIKMTEAP